jgi:hypothetical protein
MTMQRHPNLPIRFGIEIPGRLQGHPQRTHPMQRAWPRYHNIPFFLHNTLDRKTLLYEPINLLEPETLVQIQIDFKF